MRVTRRFWALVTVAAAFAGAAVALQTPLYLGVPTLVGGWLAGQQLAFTADLQDTTDALTVKQTATPDRVLEDQPVQVTATATPAHAPRNTYELTIHPPLAMDATTASAPLDDTDTTRVHSAGSYDVAGRYTACKPTLTARDPYGLFAETLAVGTQADVSVDASAPRDAVVLAGGDRISVGYGSHDASKGSSGFATGDLRQYVPGDPSNRIDWKATARLGDPYVRETDPETDRETIAVIDHRGVVADGPAGRAELDYLREAALWLVAHAASFDDPLALYAVGDGGVTETVAANTGQRHYRHVKHRLYDLTPTTGPGTEHEYTVTAQPSVETESQFGATLAPFFEHRNTYVQRIEADPLFEAVSARLARRRRSASLVLLTDDTHRAELVETVKLAHRQNTPVTVFLCANALFRADGITDLEQAYSDYREFREFQASLGNYGDVTVYEVGPSNRIDAVLAAHEPGRRRSPS